jgi:monofunctional biosynthetic peptidoglycan transglycosylase
VLLMAALGLVGFTVIPVLALNLVDPPTTAFILGRRLEGGVRIRQQWVALEKIAVWYPRAVIAAEDQKFGTHFGFDSGAIEDAIEDRLEGRSRRGASTITQQVAKNLFLWKARSWVRKGLEAYFTLLLEVCLPKRRILELHLNIAELGNGIYGVEAASQVWFKKGAFALEPGEAAALAAILPSPRNRRPDQPSASAAERASWILEQMEHLTTEVNRLVPVRK